MGHTPNQIPFGQRVLNSLLAIGLLTYGIVGLVLDDIYVPGKRNRGIHLHGGPAITMFAAMVCAVLVLLAVVVDHYDRRDNERHYKLFATIFQIAGWGCFAVALVWGLATR